MTAICLQLAGYLCFTLACFLGCLEWSGLFLGKRLEGRNVAVWLLRVAFPFLAMGLVAGGLQMGPWVCWGLVSWLVATLLLHMHHAVPFKGRPLFMALLAGWAFVSSAFFLTVYRAL